MSIYQNIAQNVVIPQTFLIVNLIKFYEAH